MQDILNNPTAMKNISYTASGSLSLFGVLSLQHIAIIIGIFFTFLTWWGSHRAVKARREEEQQRHKIEIEFIRAREQREKEMHQLAKLKFDAEMGARTNPGSDDN